MLPGARYRPTTPEALRWSDPERSKPLVTEHRWTADDIPDQTGRLAVVTGANSGLGLATARELARHGSEVVLACRSATRASRAVAQIRAELPSAKLTVLELDLGSLASVRRFVEDLSGAHAGVDLLINNAGIMATPQARTVDGFESQLGVNHLGHFALTGLLAPLLLARPAPRVVCVSSVVHRIGKIDFDDLHGARRYRRWGAYGQSKLANLLFTFELERRCAAAGLNLQAMAAHPGYAATNLQSAGKSGPLSRICTALGSRLLAQSAEHGARPSLYAATKPDLPGGSFVGPDGPFEMRGHPRLVVAKSTAYDPEVARRLWQASERLTGVAYSFQAGPATVRLSSSDLL
jgi:NAD(P)-dependent dehydrogenase (short-subunit alcohol dehydrogenase family)